MITIARADRALFRVAQWLISFIFRILRRKLPMIHLIHCKGGEQHQQHGRQRHLRVHRLSHSALSSKSKQYLLLRRLCGGPPRICRSLSRPQDGAVHILCGRGPRASVDAIAIHRGQAVLLVPVISARLQPRSIHVLRRANGTATGSWWRVGGRHPSAIGVISLNPMATAHGIAFPFSG